MQPRGERKTPETTKNSQNSFHLDECKVLIVNGSWGGGCSSSRFYPSGRTRGPEDWGVSDTPTHPGKDAKDVKLLLSRFKFVGVLVSRKGDRDVHPRERGK